MTITSIKNNNPKNDSKYARHRSIWKGSHNQLRRTIAGLNGTQRVRVYKYSDRPLLLNAALLQNWGFGLTATRLGATGFQVHGRGDINPPPAQMLRAVPEALQCDLKLLWSDFIIIAARRIGESSGAGSFTDTWFGGSGYSGNSLVVFAPGSASFDLIVSKYGYGDDLKHNHHYYHWQSRAQGFQGVVSVDDYDAEGEGTTLYVVA